MFVQIHMLQSMPPGNLNRDENGYPKQCLFGGVTRGRISSQCLKRNIRWSTQFKEAGSLATRTQYLPQMVADELKDGKFGAFADDELAKLMAAIAKKFHSDEKGRWTEDGQEDDEEKDAPEDSPLADNKAPKKEKKKPQLVFFPPSFAIEIARLVADLRKDKPRAYIRFIGGKAEPKITEKEGKGPDKKEIQEFVKEVCKASESLTVDIGLFGRMTTSELVKNVDATCQVAHAISTHETIIESDYLTAMDEQKPRYASDQMDIPGAQFIGSEMFFNSAVYYKYLNLDVDALKKHLHPMTDEDAAKVAGVLVKAAALANPTGKQNSFAAHGVPEYILVEVSEAKRPISYANAFLQPVEGGVGRNYMTESAKAINAYIDAVAAAFAPADARRVLLEVGPAKATLQSPHTPVATLDELVSAVVALVAAPGKPGASA